MILHQYILIQIPIHHDFFTSFYFWFISDAPICAVDRVVLVGAAKSETIQVLCEIHADPPAR